MNHPDDGKTRPVIIYRQGHSPQAALMNDKAYGKSLEQGELWTLHPETGRLVPFEGGGKLVELTEDAAWFSATLSVPTGSPNGGSPGAGGKGGAGAPEESTISDSDLPRGAGAESERRLTGAVLQQLQALIDERRETLPDGSYTAHLFSKGAEKIRKKTGEEAIELLLARSKNEIIYEAADLLYHLMVLLSAEELSIDEVLSELARRHG
ncbi:MAG: phosphoribosyl-ATP diphosphatase [Alkalispirochaetaceae bacterium]